MRRWVKTLFGIIFTVFGAITALGLLLARKNSYIDNDDALVSSVFVLVMGWGIYLLATAKKPSRKQIRSQKTEEAEVARKQRISEIGAVTELPVVAAPMSIMMKQGEVCHYQATATVVIIKNQVVAYSGGSGGVSVRVAKGVTLHSGRSRSAPVRQNVATEFPGFFTMTNQRIIMTGEKGFEHPLTKLTAITPWNGYAGIELQFGKSNYTIKMAEPYWVPKIIDLLNEAKLK